MFRPLGEKASREGAPLLRRSKRRKVPGGQQLNLHLVPKMSKFFSCKNVYGFLIVFLKKKRKWNRENENGKQVQDLLKGATVDLISSAYATVD